MFVSHIASLSLCFHDASHISQLLVKRVPIAMMLATCLQLCVCFIDTTNFQNAGSVLCFSWVESF